MVKFNLDIYCIGAFFVTEPVQFYATAAVVGLVYGRIQSLRVPHFPKLIPETKTQLPFLVLDVAENRNCNWNVI